MTQWDNLAEDYGLEVLAQKHILWPNLTRLLDPVFGQTRVLDIGCGNGAYTRHFYEQGADIVGIDTSSEQVSLARRTNPGPEYLRASAQDHFSANAFENLFANMVICNIPTEHELLDFFRNSYQNSTSNAHLFVTNVAPEFQRTCETEALIQTYPAKTLEGAKFDVSLKMISGETIGPFKNYHWSKQKVTDTAELGGWRLVRSTELTAEKVDGDWPSYILYEYSKK